MTTQALQIGFIEQAHRIYLFDEVYPLSAAKEQAEKKKLAAFGMLAKFNPLNRPREDTVMLTRHELRLEPFWHIVAQRQVDYEARVTYAVRTPSRRLTIIYIAASACPSCAGGSFHS